MLHLNEQTEPDASKFVIAIESKSAFFSTHKHFQFICYVNKWLKMPLL